MATAVSLDLSIDLAPSQEGGYLLKNPVIGASGTFGYGTELANTIDIQRLGAIVCKGITRHPRSGNPQPRLVETSSGLLNTIGLQNVGVKGIIEDKAPIWAKWDVPVIVNISGETVEEYGEIAGLLDGVPGISSFEVNIGCPNVEKGGVEFGADPEIAARVTETVKLATSLPVIVKLTPNVTSITKVAEAVEEAGADAVSMVNTFIGISINVAKRGPGLSTIKGGLSGPAIKPIALAMVYETSRSVKIPVIGMGGIFTAEDALEFIMAGASAIQVGTANFLNPSATIEVLEGIENFMRQQGETRLSDLIGIARR